MIENHYYHSPGTQAINIIPETSVPDGHILIVPLAQADGLRILPELIEFLAFKMITGILSKYTCIRETLHK
ncbi:hypothetical protein D3C76_1517720 [compost metagenome]